MHSGILGKYRDLKPENVLVFGNGSAKITGFGMACSPSHFSYPITATVGAPGYMLPVIFENRISNMH